MAWLAAKRTNEIVFPAGEENRSSVRWRGRIILEDEAGGRPFQRTHTGVQLTGAGHLMADTGTAFPRLIVAG